MLNKVCQSRAVILTTLVLLETPSLCLAQKSSLSELHCTNVEIEKDIQQSSNGESAAFNELVACKSKAVPGLTRSLEKAMEKQDENVTILTITALSEIGEKTGQAKDAIPALTTALHSQDRDSQLIAAVALANMGIKSENVVSVLIANLEDSPDCDHVFLAQKTLRKMNRDVNVIPIYYRYRKRFSRKSCQRKPDISREASRQELRRKRQEHRHGISPQLRKQISKYITTKPLLICEIPQIKSLLSWKCP